MPKESHLSTVKMEPRWSGPFLVSRKVGEHSYEIEIGPGKYKQAYRDQLAEWVDDELVGKPTPLYYYSAVDEALEEDFWPVKEILGHRVKKGVWEFLTSWEGCPSSEDSWEPVPHFFTGYFRPLIKYNKTRRLNVIVPEFLEREDA